MPISRAPYIEYSEQVSTVDYTSSTFADIPVILAPCKIKKYDSTGTLITETTGTGDEAVTTEYFPGAVSKDEILIFSNYTRASARISDVTGEGKEVLEFLEQFFEEADTQGIATGYGIPYVYFIPLPLNPTNDDLKNAIKLVDRIREITAIMILGVTNHATTLSGIKDMVLEPVKDGYLRIAYAIAPERASNTTVAAYAASIYTIGNTVNCSRIALIHPTEAGRIFAHICQTPYAVEPGYLPLNSTSVGVFEYLTKDERDALCMSGLIFGEDDDILPVTLPRICLGTSTAFSRNSALTDPSYGNRKVDSMLHHRRNVDHHVREIFRILSIQLKNNESSVSLRYLKQECVKYLNEQLSKGALQAYSINIVEASYNPYCLLVTGEMTPNNATLAIEFQNYVYAPYSVASDYI